MDCCNNKNITCKNCENICINCVLFMTIDMLMKYLLEITI